MPKESLDLTQFHYNLPDNLIAKFPISKRDEAKLLVYKKGAISDLKFYNLPALLPADHQLIFNDTKVIPARMILHKESGARIEIFLLEPHFPSHLYEKIMSSVGHCKWKVMIGNAKKWKIGTSLNLNTGTFELEAVRDSEDLVSFKWTGVDSFSQLLLKIGEIPLPPYMGRSATEEDVPRYQTVYSRQEGAVAAPTAGLHFTREVIDDLVKRGIKMDYLTLHVSAGTFQPIKTKNIDDHPMHREQVIITRENVENLLDNEKIIAVGTTSMRSLESLFWYGNRLENYPEAGFSISKEEAYHSPSPVSLQRSLKNVLNYMDEHNLRILTGNTEIFIYPGYQFKVCKGLITNFHLPGSTLILLVAALIGNDWKKVYEHAMTSGYRFLSYGDSSLLLP